MLIFRIAGQRAALLAGLFRFQQFRARADLQDRRCMGLPDRVRLAGSTDSSGPLLAFRIAGQRAPLLAGRFRFRQSVPSLIFKIAAAWGFLIASG